MMIIGILIWSYPEFMPDTRIEKGAETMKRIATAVLVLMLGVLIGAAAAGHNLEPVKVEASTYGVQITYANGGGYWYEY